MWETRTDTGRQLCNKRTSGLIRNESARDAFFAFRNAFCLLFLVSATIDKNSVSFFQMKRTIASEIRREIAFHFHFVVSLSLKSRKSSKGKVGKKFLFDSKEISRTFAPFRLQAICQLIQSRERFELIANSALVCRSVRRFIRTFEFGVDIHAHTHTLTFFRLQLSSSSNHNHKTHRVVRLSHLP